MGILHESRDKLLEERRLLDIDIAELDKLIKEANPLTKAPASPRRQKVKTKKNDKGPKEKKTPNGLTQRMVAQQNRLAILTLMGKDPESEFTVADILRETDMTRSQAIGAMRWLVDKGEITFVGVRPSGGLGNPPNAYQLAAPAPVGAGQDRQPQETA